MADLKGLHGAGTALVTPFTTDDHIDEAAIKRLVDFQIEGGIDFLVPCGTTGESATWDQEAAAEGIYGTEPQGRSGASPSGCGDV